MDHTAIAAQLIAADDLEGCLAALGPQLSWTVVAAIKARVDAMRMRNAARALRIAAVGEAVAARLADPAAQRIALWARGNALYGLSRYHEALACYRQAEGLHRAGEHDLEIARLRINQVAVLMDLGAFAEALAVADTARADCASIGPAAQPFVALLEMNSGGVYQQLARPAEALAAYARGRAILVGLDNAVEVARIDINRANVLQEMGRFAEAAGLYATARDVLRAHAHDQEVAKAEHNLGKLAYRRGRYQEALRHLEAARAAYAAIPNPIEVAKADLYRALAYCDLGLLAETVELAEAAGRAFARADTRWERAMALVVAGVARSQLGQHKEAERLLARARRLLRALGALDRLPPLDVDRASLYLAQGQVATARRLAARVARHVQPSDWPAVAARARITLARCALAGPEPDPAALAHASAARALAERYDLSEGAPAAHVAGLAHARGGDIAAARAAYAAAVAAVEGLRARLPVDDLQLGFVDSHLAIYRDAAHLSLLHDSPAAGLAALSLTLSAPLPRRAASASHALSGKLDALREAWHWHQSRVEDLAEGQGQRKALASRLRAIEADLGDLLLRRDVLTSPDAPDRPPPTLAPDELAAALSARLGADEGLLLVARADEHVALVLVTAGGVARRVAPALGVERTLRSWRFHLQYVISGAPAPQAMAAARAHLARFYDALVAPLAAELGALRRLVVALDPAWHDLPLAAAFDGERYLVERLEVAYCTAPEALLADAPRPSDPRAPALVIGHSDGGRLPTALAEAEAVATLLAGQRPVELLLEDAASLARARAALPGCGLLHVASHAAFRADSPRFSWVRLAGGRLSVADLAETQLRAGPLVVLSACETGRGRPRGGGLLGMGRALLAAGASTLVVSLWEIADASTATLMRSFYAASIAGAPAAAALAAAQRGACARGEHPFYWAGFVCIER